MDVHTFGNVAGSHAVESVSIYQRIALYHLSTVSKGLVAQLFVIVVLRHVDQEVTTHNAVHQYGNTPELTRFADIAGQHIVEG